MGLIQVHTDEVEQLHKDLQMAEERCETWKQQCQREQDELRALKTQIAELAKRCRAAQNCARVWAKGATQEHTRKRAETVRDIYAAEADDLEKLLA